MGWRDLGVFGNEDWQVPDLYGSPSARGLAAFDKEGGILALAEASPEHDEIADCYALSVSGDTAFACVYTDFSPDRMFPWWWDTLVVERPYCDPGTRHSLPLCTCAWRVSERLGPYHVAETRRPARAAACTVAPQLC